MTGLPIDQERIEEVAGWIYDNFDVEQRITGYRSDRHVSKTDFIKRVLFQFLT